MPDGLSGLSHTISISLLIVEDEEKVAQFVRRSLERERYSVDIAADGESALDRLKLIPYDLVILDLTLPRRGGLEILHLLRKEKNNVPVLILTARSSVADRVKALDLGADDYLVKPFAIEELLARVRMLLRLKKAGLSTLLQADDLTLNPLSREVKRAGRNIELSSKEYALLEYFMKHPNRVLTRSMISDSVWDIQSDTFSNMIDVYVNHLREKIDRGFKSPLIHTVRGIGYVLKP